MASSPFDPLRPDEWRRRWMDLLSSSPAKAASFGIPSAWAAGWDPFGSLLDAVRDRLIGRRRTIKIGDRDLTMVLDELIVTGTDFARSLGQYGGVRVTAHDIETELGGFQRLRVTADNVHLRADESVPTLVAAPVRWELSGAPEAATAWLRVVAPRFDVSFDRGLPRVGLAGRLRWLRLQVDLIAEGRSVRVVPRVLHVWSRQMRLRLPSYNVPIRNLGDTDWITSIELTREGIVVRGVRSEWRRSLSRQDVDRLVAAVRAGVGRLEV